MCVQTKLEENSKWYPFSINSVPRVPSMTLELGTRVGSLTSAPSVASGARDPRVLFVTGSQGYPSGLSGYDRLTENFSSSVVCGYDRKAKGWLRWANPLARGIAASRWVLPATLLNELKVRGQLQRSQFDLVHVLWGERDFGIIDHVAAAMGVPLVVSFHAPYGTDPNPLRRLAAIRSLAGVVLVSSSQLPFFTNQLPTSVPRRVILHGIDLQAFSPPTVAPSIRPFVVCFAGSFRRDFAVLEQVIERFQGDLGFEFHLLVPAAVQARFVRFESVKFFSGLSDLELANFYRRASCLLMTLQDSTANNAVLEALATGLPVVAEDVGGTREYVGPAAGRLLPKGDVDGLVAGLRGLRDDPALRRRLGEGARARAGELSWESVSEELKSFYGEVVANVAMAANGRN
jgi:glycosyltransferase involved in cell wall biosynthesis